MKTLRNKKLSCAMRPRSVRWILACAAAGCGMAFTGTMAMAQAPVPDVAIRPPTPGKQDPDPPVISSYLFIAIMMGAVLTVSMQASKRSHQD